MRPHSAGPVSPEQESGSGVDGEPVREFCGQPSALRAERHQPVAGCPRWCGGWSLPATGGVDELAEAFQAVGADALGGHGAENHITVEQTSSLKVVENSRCLLTVERWPITVVSVGLQPVQCRREPRIQPVGLVLRAREVDGVHLCRPPAQGEQIGPPTAASEEFLARSAANSSVFASGTYAGTGPIPLPACRLPDRVVATRCRWANRRNAGTVCSAPNAFSTRTAVAPCSAASRTAESSQP